MKRHSIVSTIPWVTLLTLPILIASCGGDSGDDLFGGGNPKPDAGNAGKSGQSGNGGSSGAAGSSGGAGSAGMGTGGTGAQSSGGTAGTGGASAGTSGTGAGATSGSGGASGTAGSGGSAGSSGTTGSGGSGATDASAGTSGTAGTGGSAGSAGTSGSAGSAGDGGSDAGGGTAGADAGSDSGTDAGPKPCTNNNQCKNDEFCSKLNCAMLTGECKPRPKVCAANEAPVCGCDGVNYWNDCLRQLVGTAASTSGECLTAATCGGLVGYTCPLNRASCAHVLTNELACGVADAFGTCWVIPEQCPQIVAGSTHRPCSGTDRCVSKCEAIKTEHDYFTDSTCPQ